ncbi:MAG: hypothetical protein FWF49_05455, partial [Oscillospiraceae bacterium]|nr:hypothetical protein [Oscillospiraceae bacterium]
MTVTATTFAFRPITLEDGAWLAPLMRTGSPNCEQSFTTLFMWRSHYNTTVCRMGGAALFRSGENGFRVPLGGDLRQNLRLLR